MTENKWIVPILVMIGFLTFYFYLDYEDYVWEILFFVLLIFFYHVVNSSLSYIKGIKSFDENTLLNAKEKWDFLYQDIWVPILIVFLLMCFFLFPLDEKSMAIYLNLPMFFKVVFDKLILRNKLIVDDNKIVFSKSGEFSEIKFRLVEGMIFDEDEGRVTINYEKIILPKYNFLSTKLKTLDIDEIEVVKDEIKVLKRQGLFKKDWNDFKVILDEKSKEYDFGLSVVYPI